MDIRFRSTAEWPREPLSVEDEAAIRTHSWPRFGLATTIAIVEAWNAGWRSREMAAALGCGTQSIAMLVGKLRQIGIPMVVADPAVSARRLAQERGSASFDWSAAREAKRQFAATRAPGRRIVTRGDVTRSILGDPEPGRTPWAAPDPEAA